MAITGMAEAEAIGDVKVFQAGTTIENGHTVSNGGRVLCVTALGADLAAAQKRAYEALKFVKMDNAYFRKDIGFKGFK